MTRDRIIEVAGTRGLDGLTIQSLAAELEVSPGALYRHVDGLDEIARLVAERKRDDVERRMTTTRDWAEWLRAFAGVIRTELGGSTSALLGSGDRRPMEIGVGESGLRLVIDAGLTPVGAALIGLKAGDGIDWRTRSGEMRHLTVIEVEDKAPDASPLAQEAVSA